MKQYLDKRILITGANGFIGKHLNDYLINIDCTNVYNMIRTNNKPNNLEGEILFADISKKDEVEKIIQYVKPEIIFHLAANIKPSRDTEDIKGMIETNICGTMNVLTCIKESNIKLDSFINLGSCEEYGYTSQPFTEEKVPSPTSIYSGTKAAVSVMCKMFYNLYGIPIITARPSLIYGPGQSERFFITQAIKNLINNKDFDMTYGEQTRDFIFVEDLVKGLVELSNTNELKGDIVNISSGIEYKLNEIVEVIKELCNSNSTILFGKVPYRQGEIMSYSCSNEKIKKMTKWRPEISICEGLEKTINFLEKDV